MFRDALTIQLSLIISRQVNKITPIPNHFDRKELRRGRLEGLRIGTSAIRIYKDSLQEYMKKRKILPDEKVLDEEKREVNRWV